MPPEMPAAQRHGEQAQGTHDGLAITGEGTDRTAALAHKRHPEVVQPQAEFYGDLIDQRQRQAVQQEHIQCDK